MKYLLTAIVLVGALVTGSRPASAQMIVSDPSTEWATYAGYIQQAQTAYSDAQTAYTTAQQLASQVKNSLTFSSGNYSDLTGDLATLLGDLSTDPSSGDTNDASVNNGNLAADYSTDHPVQLDANGDPIATAPATSQATFLKNLKNKLAGVLQAMKTNQAQFNRAQNSGTLVSTYQSQNDAAGGTNQLLQTTNGLLIEVIKDLSMQQAASAVNMQAMLADNADQTELGVQATSDWGTRLQNIQTEYSTPNSLTAF